MASAPEIFISYAQIDNEPLSESHAGWVDEFHGILRIRLGQLRGESVTIWRDAKLQGNDEFSDGLADRLANVRLFIPIISPRYVRSEWCRKELREFLEASQKTGGASIGDWSRVFKVVKMPVPHEDLPQELQEVIGYQFFKMDHDTGRFRELSLSQGDEKLKHAYFELIDALAHDVSKTLGAWRERRTSKIVGASRQVPRPKSAPEASAETESASKEEFVPPVGAPAAEDLPPKELFVCYSRKDEDFAIPLARKLMSHGVNVFIDQLSIPDGADWDLSIDEALERCAMLVVVLSPTAVESRQVRSEWNLAFEEGKPVLPVMREKCRVPRQLRLYQHLDMTAGKIDDEGVLIRLVNAVQSL